LTETIYILQELLSSALKERFEFLELDTAGVVLVQDLEEGTHVLALN
jgi:hypothetical protein